MYIGELARRTGTTPKALRHYESLGILPAPRRRGRYRDYSEEHHHYVEFIQSAKALGLTLNEIRAAGPVDPQAPYSTGVAALLQRKRQALHDDIQRRQQALNAIDQCLNDWQRCTDA
ncbi:hypothetical protein BGP77_15985 [Saccharospirillum sp. MSK14-1]|uniref:MerR family transcriptional regulator n=1 Tax=Saccharospirillum sp. MSK14-1 TaxID=1897632 RepID=UPI000D398C13|nr:MerR family transcriptional regulator [Saccharospirillum sp. MSK14-1]PTY37959.1 hypothetical protein BGP77_15985 [Saccharospirillum sp. MSK14-1]